MRTRKFRVQLAGTESVWMFASPAYTECREMAVYFSMIHEYNGYMQKIQILFPDSQMKKLREMAKREDRPISEIVRRAIEA